MHGMLRWLALAGAVWGCILPRAHAGLTLKLVAAGLKEPILATAPVGDDARLFIVERYGLIRVVRDGVLLPDPYLDLRSRVSTDGYNGLIGLAFHPQFLENGLFYVFLGRGGISLLLQRFTAAGIPLESDAADADSAVTILPIIRSSDMHVGGSLSFSPVDGHLYVSVGDGDETTAPQNLGSLLGKILRIDVDGGTPYAIPPDNPFAGVAGARPEILAYGFRNPFRGSVDRETGDYWVGDVGVASWEEVNLIPKGTGGQNFGWTLAEGPACRGTESFCDEVMPGVTPAYHAYNHNLTVSRRAAVIGGYVYRGAAIPWMRGRYVFGDYALGRVWSLRQGAQGLREHTQELDPDKSRLQHVSAFGEDARGELYVLDFSGSVYKIVVPEEDFHSADRNRDGAIRLSELLRVIQMYNSGGIRCAEGSEDDYALGPGGTDCPPHDSDYAPQDWRIELPELLRLIQIFNSGAYAPCAEGEDGVCLGEG